jgi:hypothetical protein
MNLVNLTPHEIVLAFGAERMAIPASGIIARVASTPGVAETINGVPVPVMGRQTWGKVENLPAPVEGTFYIVSAQVLGRPECLNRTDVVGPGTGPNDGAIRVPDGPRKGQVEAVTRLVRG